MFTYTYNFGRDVAMTDDIIESDATVDCSDYETFDEADDASVFNSQRQEPRYGLDNAAPNHPPWKEHRAKAKDHEGDLQLNDTDTTCISSSIETETSERLTGMSMTTSPPPSHSDKDLEERLAEEDMSKARRVSIQLGTTPRSIRFTDFDSSSDSDTEPETEESTLPLLRRPPSICEYKEASESPLIEIEETSEICRASTPPWFSDVEELATEEPPREECAVATEVIRRGSPGPTAEEDDESLQYTVSDAILDLNNLMSKPFWANDEKWFLTIRGPTPRSQIFTPYSSDLIKTTTRLIEVMEWISKKQGNVAQAQFAVAMCRRIDTYLAQIRDACNTISVHVFGDQQRGSQTDLPVHFETIRKMKTFVIPRMVVIISKAFTLLCNQIPALRNIVLCIIEEVCLDIGYIMELIEKSENLGNDTENFAEVQEFMHSLAVVQEWTKQA